MRIDRWIKGASVVAVGAVVAGALMPLSAGAARRRALIAEVTDASGNRVGVVRIVRTGDAKTVVWARLAGLTPGFHGFHVHATSTCDPDAQDTSGNPAPFFSAGGHYNPETSNTHGAHAGDMPPLLAAKDGTALLRFKTDRFTPRQLLDSDGSAVIVHAAPDNLAHVPAATPAGEDRYHSHVDDVLGADAVTKATGDAGARLACGVIEHVSG